MLPRIRREIHRQEQWFSTKSDLDPRVYLTRSEDIFGHHNWEEGGMLPLAFSW